MIDTHCHIDLYNDPMAIALECERNGVITLAMTNLPSHFEMGYPHIKNLKKVRLALGMHPLYAEQHHNELIGFTRNLSKTSYIGEIGLDYSKKGIATKDLQLASFKCILKTIKKSNKILSIHSRKAEVDVLRLLLANQVTLAIFHWYTGPVNLIADIIEAGYYFSVNPAMIKSKSGQQIVGKIPLVNLLTESDGPFVVIDNKCIKPTDLHCLHQYLAGIHNLKADDIERHVYLNFQRMIKELK